MNEPMSKEFVLFEKTGRIGKIIIDRPDADNTINNKVAMELDYICNEINNDSTIMMVVITGAGDRVFSLGIDSAELGSTDDRSSEDPARKRSRSA